MPLIHNPHLQFQFHIRPTTFPSPSPSPFSTPFPLNSLSHNAMLRLDAPLLQRTLHAFNRFSRSWEPVPLHSILQVERIPSPQAYTPSHPLTLSTWNIRSSNPPTSSRFLKDIPGSDVIFLQNVSPEVGLSILEHPGVRKGCFVTDPETSMTGGLMTILCKERFSPFSTYWRDDRLMIHDVFRRDLPSDYEKDALGITISSPCTSSPCSRTPLHLLNVHLDPLDTQLRRIQQLTSLNFMRLDDGGGVIAGDFSALTSKDNQTIHELNLLDTWYGYRAALGARSGSFDNVALVGAFPLKMEFLAGRVDEDGRSWCERVGMRYTFVI